MITLGVGPTETAASVVSSNTVIINLLGTTAGRSLVVGVYWVDSSGTRSVSDIACSGESALALHTKQRGTDRNVQFASLANITTGGDKTITVTFDNTGTYEKGAFAVEFDGGDTANFFDAQNTNFGTGTTASTSVTTSAAGALVMGLAFSSGAGNPSAGSGYTLVGLTEISGGAAGEYDLDAGAAGSKTVDFTVASGNWAIAAIAFNVGTGATVSPTGVSATGAVGSPSVTGTASVIPTGVSATGQLGTVQAGTVMTVPVTGVAATGALGTVSAAGTASIPVTGVAATGSPGTVAVAIGITVNVTGVQATGFVGAEAVTATVRALAEHEAPVGYQGYLAEHEAPLGYFFMVEHEALYSLMGSALAVHEASYDLLTRALAEHEALYDLRALNPGFVEHEACWSLLAANVSTITQRPFLEWRGEHIDLIEASVSQDEGGQFWSVRVAVANAQDYLRLSRLDPIALDIFGDRYELVIEGLGRSNAGRGVDQRFDLSARSVLWATLAEPGPRVTQTWGAVMARATVEELAGEAVDWRILDWLIPAGRLAAVNEAPISVIGRIVAPGAVVESAKDGGLIVRYLYPVTIPQVAGADVDHELTESGDIFSITERLSERQPLNRVTLTDASAQRGYLAAERDDDQPDVIFGGESQKFLVFHSDDVAVQEILLSAGSLIPAGETTISVVDEEITFSNTNEAQVSKIVSSGFGYTWFGTGLGEITVDADRRKLVAASVGVGIARVSYQARARRYSVLSPLTAGGRSEFPIVVYVIGALSEDEVSGASPFRIVVQRGAGDLPADDVVVPLAGNENVLLNHGRNLIDSYALKAATTVTTAYPPDVTGEGHVMNGDLILVADSQLGATWRGKAVNINHQIKTDRKGATTVESVIAAERFL